MLKWVGPQSFGIAPIENDADYLFMLTLKGTCSSSRVLWFSASIKEVSEMLCCENVGDAHQKKYFLYNKEIDAIEKNIQSSKLRTDQFDVITINYKLN